MAMRIVAAVVMLAPPASAQCEPQAGGIYEIAQS